jgi:hypothetical protein
MALIVVFDEGASPQAVLDVIPSANTPDYSARTDVLVNPDLSSVAGLAEKYWKVVGSAVDPMTAQEQSDVDAAEAAAADAAMRTGAKAAYDGQTVDGQKLRALVEVLLREVNILRQQHSLADRTLAQAKAAIQQAIDDGDVDE